MFTGIIETVGKVRAAVGSSPRRLTIESQIDSAQTKVGDSVALDGCCLTIVANSDALVFEAATETLERTTLGGLRAGDGVHMERALQLGGRLDGHLVSGHVDAVGTLRQKQQRGSALYMAFEGSKEVLRLTAPQGSICVAGVSLTVTDVDDDLIWVGLIPHTLKVTGLGSLEVGSSVNLEVDLIARYVARLVGSGYTMPTQPSTLTEKFLQDKGFA